MSDLDSATGPRTAADLGELQARIQQLIPLTKALGLELVEFDGRTLVVGAPLEANHNHQHTAFGGSLYCVGVMAAWSLLQLWLDEKGLAGSIIIQSGAIDYAQPVSDDFQATASLPADAVMARAETMLRRHGKARLSLASDLLQHGDSRGRFIGRFVVLQNQ